MISIILLNTPLWVYAVFALLLWLGLGQLRTRSISIHRVWLTPMIFIIWGLLGLILSNSGSMAGLLPWLGAALVGALAGLLGRNTLVINRERGTVLRPAGMFPLLRNLIVFGAHYGLNVVAAFYPGQHSIMQIDMAVSGLFAGYFAGWLIRFVQNYFATGAVGGGSVNKEDGVAESAVR